MYTVDIDVGGTLTDGLFSDGRKAIPVKVDTTPHDLTVCFQDCLTAGAHELGFSDLREFLQQVHLIRWSTTITSNVLAQRSGPRLGLLVSQGHERDLYAPQGSNPALGSLVAPENVIGLTCPIDPQEVLLAVKTLLTNGVRRICISLEGAYLDPSHELAAKRAIEAQYPDHFLGTVPVLLGSELSHYPDAETRTTQSLLNAYLHGPLASALYKAEDDLREAGYERPLLIGHANGGVARVSKTKAIDTLEAGPTMGLFAAAHFARTYGLAHVITLDVGGTTAKVGVIQEGRLVMTSEADLFGVPVKAPTVLLQSIALGGGSVASVEAASGQLRLGPESMGAYPGPACYDLGGTEATLTDSLLTLGWLPADYFLGGKRKLNPQRAHEAITARIAEPLGKSIEQAALEIANRAFQLVATTIREVLARMGWWPEDSTLFAFGGNGPIFACSVAERAGIARALVFDLSAVFSAFGSAIADVVHVYEHGLNLSLAADEDRHLVCEVIERMRREALHDMRGEGFAPERVRLQLEAEISDPQGKLSTAVLELAPTTSVEPAALQAWQGKVVLLRLRATVAMPHYEAIRRSGKAASGEGALRGQRPVSWGSVSAITPVYSWEALQPGEEIAGGAILESAWTTYPVLPGWSLRMDEYGNGQLQRKGG
ncbi:hydantoinase/oxoprolinase family protein [Thermogemmatispora tikiterensis]|uniref:Hydantoinase n=1 Tax=Thermogemmatispora tikiterensis TaxID=1825093 RepID=A0A328V8U0_9CHLR|nr:hydantoinase/oxoprolinase family protein [Thermogemmatispora tikiterensis]RAQ94036.1 hypothetical protein A4R35_00730 [Thermogemmatispora tikiterensis]